MKLLINTPDYHNPSSGGVASYYYGMLGYWNENVKYNIIGRRRGLSGAAWLLWDVIKFIFKLLVWRPDVVVINPSLMKNALKRDFVFLKTASVLGFPVVVLIHGFNLDNAKLINHYWVKENLNKATLIMTLANKFREIMTYWGVTKPIELISTKVEDRMLDGFDIKSRDGGIKQILFLSRIIKEKGIYEMIDSFCILKKKYPYLKFLVVGDGPELGNIKDYATKCKLDDVTFTGALDGEKRLNAYRESDLFFFASYGEGMPTVVLEAMAFGMPVITRNVGGLVDFFEDGKMGRITDSLNPEEFAEMTEPFLKDKELTRRVSQYNHQYAMEHFMATKVGKRIESLIKKYTQTC